MILRTVVFVAVCAPVWVLYSLHETDQDKQLPAASAVAWTGVQGTLCFAGPVSLACGQSMNRGGRRIRVVRKRSCPVRVPAVCIVDASNAVANPAKPVSIDPKTWGRLSRIMNGPPAVEATLPPAKRPVLRRSRVKFFDGRVTLCGIGGVVMENPEVFAPTAEIVSGLPIAVGTLDDRRRKG